MIVDADFPGGNISIERIADDVVWLHQELRDTEGPWFYWAFRVRGAAGRKVSFQFTDGDVLGVRGPAVSYDDGINWQWLGAACVARDSEAENEQVCFAIDLQTDDVLLSYCPLYTESHLQRFVDALPPGALGTATLCGSRRGRNTERLTTTSASPPRYRLLLTCRHHACETMASYCLEGFLEAAVGEDELGVTIREQMEIAAIPFMDRDGVEAGDQGKNRLPFDHNRDYGGDPSQCLYPETRALREWAPAWLSGAEVGLFIDLHCPWIRGGRNEEAYFVAPNNGAQWTQSSRFFDLLQANCSGEIVYRAANNLPFGCDWNTLSGKGLGQCSSSKWAVDLPGVALACTLEIPYANAGGGTVTPSSCRIFGRDLARSLSQFTQQPRDQS